MSEQDDREAHNAELQERANAEEQADDAGLSPQDSWARVELWRWQYGTLPTPDDMRPLDVAYGMVQMAKALDLPMKRGADMPMPCNVAAVLRYAAKIIQAGNALYLNKGRVDGVDAGRVVCAGGGLLQGTPRRVSGGDTAQAHQTLHLPRRCGARPAQRSRCDNASRQRDRAEVHRH